MLEAPNRDIQPRSGTRQEFRFPQLESLDDFRYGKAKVFLGRLHFARLHFLKIRI